MADHKTPDVDPQSVHDAQAMWHSFANFGKYTIIGVALVLIFLTIAFVRFS